MFSLRVLGAVAKLERALIAERNILKAAAQRRSVPAATRSEHLEKTDRGNQLTQPQTKGDQTDAATVLCPTATPNFAPSTTLDARQQAAGIEEGPVFRWIWLPSRPNEGAPPGEPLPCPGLAPPRSRPRP